MTPAPAPDRRRLLLALVIVWLIWGSTYFAIGIMVQSMPPLLAAGLRYFLAGALVFAAMKLSGAPWPSWRQWAWAALVGTLLFASGNGTVTVVSKFLPSSFIALLVATTPMWLVLFTALADGKKPTTATWQGLALGLVGVAILSRPDHLGGGLLMGLIAVLLATASWALGSFLSAKGSQPESLVMAAAIQQLGGGAALLLAALVRGESLAVTQVSAASWIAFAYLVVFGSIIAFIAFVWLLRHAPPALAASYAYVNPLVAVALGVLFGGEHLSWEIALGGSLIVAAVALLKRG